MSELIENVENEQEYLLQVKNLKKYFPIGKAFLPKNQKYFKLL